MFKRINLTFIGNLLSKASTFVVLLYTLHVIAKFNNLQTYAIWAILTSITSLAVLFDFGIGSFLTNALSSNIINDKTRRNLLQNGLLQVLVFATFCGLIISYMLYVSEYFDASKHINRGAFFYIVFFFAVFLSILQSAISRICYGLFEANILNASIFLFNIFSCLAIYCSENIQKSLSYYIVISLILPQFFCIFLIFYISKKFNIFKEFLITKSTQLILISNGIGFWLMQLSGVISIYLDPILIGAYSNEENVVAFNSVQKYFLILVQVPYLYSLGLWPVYSRLFTTNKFDELKKIFRRTLKVATNIIIIIGLPVLILWKDIISLWLGGDMYLTTRIVTLYFILAILQIYGTAISIYFNGCGILRGQVFGSILCMVLLIPLKIFSISFYNLEFFILSWLIFYTIFHLCLYLYMFSFNKKISPII